MKNIWIKFFYLLKEYLFFHNLWLHQLFWESSKKQKLEIAISQQVITPQDVATVQSLYLDNTGWE